MKKNVLFFLLLSICLNAQINRFFYEYKYVPDINNKTEVNNEMMLLDVDSKGSNYYSYDRFVSDSTMMANIEKQLKTGGALNLEDKGKSGLIDYKVTKSYPDFNTCLFQNISYDKYKIKENEKPEWKVLNEKQKIGEYNAQKATTSFGGRDWIAWFSTEIPIQDGPYKFYGLPGLIVKLEDTTGTHIMTLVGNKSVKASAETEKDKETKVGGVSVMFTRNKEIEVTKEKFRKLWKEYVNDPSKNMRNMVNAIGGDGGNVIVKHMDRNGNEITDPNKVARERAKLAKESLAKNNNPIEPDLVK
ncbi:GLPGLI family protein [Chryseobacterium sp. SLBN-27]|uniref:GLPGLI family protein n=1 Tax=Chryseobacterium sp. SLBN-27 TaxID=3042287 RepID=UPI00258B8CAA|nr:GLPGLI family protein [Chryseobacterium sp. SLBN-27]MDR6157172.1 GLPGLI family protein [Chryseobacterium sp. SLBN-27]